MKKAVLGMSLAALMASAAFANAQTSEDENTRVAAADPSVAAFKKLDADTDGRVSAIEAANDTNVAASFTKADSDKDGYLSKDEFKMIGSSDDSIASPPSSPQSDPATSEPQQ